MIIFFAVTTKAQINNELAGLVHNSQGETIEGAIIRVLNSNFITVTNKSGVFKFINLQPKAFDLEVVANGYATALVRVKQNSSNLEITLIASSKQLGEVIVTAEKSDQPLQKLPLSITAFSAKQIQDSRLLNIKDITAIVPNLNAANSGDNRNVVSIRGITTTSYDPTVATYIDGVNQFGLDTYIAQLEDIERIEVLRGPQGTLYGRNALGGVINIITKQPGEETKGFVEAGFGNYKQQRYSFGLRMPVVAHKLYFGIAVLYTNQNGFYTNDFDNSRFDDQHSFMGNYYLRYVPNNKLKITLNVKNVANRNNGTFPLASDPASALSNPFRVNQNNVTNLVDNVFNSSLSLNYTGEKFNFNSQSAYQSNYRYYKQPIDGDFSPIDGVSIINNYGDAFNKVKVGTQEIRFNSPANSSSKLTWLVGLYGFYQNNPVKQAIHFGKDGTLVGAPVNNFSIINTNKQKVFGAATFGQASLALNAKLSITLGLRYDYAHNKLHIKGEFAPDGQSATTTTPDTASAKGFNAFSPKFSLAYRVSDEVNLYGSYNRGFRTGGIAQLGSDPDHQPPLYAYQPEKSDNFEIGLKNMFWQQRIRLNAAFFYAFINNAQVPTLILPDAITVVKNAGKLVSKGAELEMTIKPLKGLEADYSFGFTDAKYKSLDIATGNGNAVNLSGNRQIFTPNVTSMLALQYNWQIGKTQPYQLFVRTEWRYLGKQYFDLANNISQDAFHLFNTNVGVATKYYALSFWTANLFNRRYIDYAYDFGAAHLGNPQTFGLSLRADF